MLNLLVGGTGFLAGELLKRLQGEIRVVARNEKSLVELKQQYPNIEILTGDIADEWTAKRAMRGVDKCWHLAAIKGVDIAEQQPFQTIRTNVIGTINLLKESLEVKPSLFLFISTDKAAQVNGVYGATKFLSEKLLGEAERINPQTQYRTVRYGNVWNSSGSFSTKVEGMIKGGKIKLTDPGMTRFFWTREEAVDHIFECIENSKDSTPYIPRMKAVNMLTVIEACQDVYGKCEVEVIGNRGGENLHETMDGKIFSNEVDHYTKEEFKNKFLK